MASFKCKGCGRAIRKGTKACPKCKGTVFIESIELSEEERGLLLYPPTESTWICTNDHVVAGSYKECWACKEKRPRRPKLLWPKYVAACQKVGVEPGFRWKQLDDKTPVMRLPGHGWREAPKPEGL